VSEQKTLTREGSISGAGLHSGAPCTVTLRPAPAEAGLRFFRNGRPILSEADPQARRCTAIGRGEARIDTVEHLLAALWGAGVTNADIDADGPELPALDGSARAYLAWIRGLGTSGQGAPAAFWSVTEPLFCHEGNSAIAAFPAEEFSASYVLDYDHPVLKNQKAEYAPSGGRFDVDVAPARTFCTEDEADALRAQGFGKGADASNTIVVTAAGPVSGPMRFPNECARHKLLDLIGDLHLLGFALVARVSGIRSGHSLNRKLVQAIRKQREASKR